MSKKTRSIIISAVAVLLVAALAIGGYFIYEEYRPKPEDTVSNLSSGEQAAKKKVTLIITDSVNGGESKTYNLETNADYLDKLLEESGVIEGKEGAYGFEITTANGVVADNGKNQYWAIYVNGEYGNYGASSQPVNNGDSFEIKLESWQ